MYTFPFMFVLPVLLLRRINKMMMMMIRYIGYIPSCGHCGGRERNK